MRFSWAHPKETPTSREVNLVVRDRRGFLIQLKFNRSMKSMIFNLYKDCPYRSRIRSLWYRRCSWKYWNLNRLHRQIWNSNLVTKYISMWRLCWKNWLCNRQNVSTCAYWVVCSDDCGWSSLQKRATIREHSQQRQLDFNEWCNILIAEVPLDKGQQLSRTETGWWLNRLARLKPNKIKTIFSQTNSLLNKEA